MSFKLSLCLRLDRSGLLLKVVDPLVGRSCATCHRVYHSHEIVPGSSLQLHELHELEGRESLVCYFCGTCLEKTITFL